MKARARFASVAARECLHLHGLDDLPALLECGEIVSEGRHDHKEVARLNLGGSDGGEVFVKRQWRRSRRIPTLREMRRLAFLRGDPVSEWWGLHRMRALGLAAAHPLAVFDRLFSVESAVITARVPCDKSLRELAREGALDRLPETIRCALIEAITAVVRQIHDGGGTPGGAWTPATSTQSSDPMARTGSG